MKTGSLNFSDLHNQEVIELLSVSRAALTPLKSTVPLIFNNVLYI